MTESKTGLQKETRIVEKISGIYTERAVKTIDDLLEGFLNNFDDSTKAAEEMKRLAEIASMDARSVPLIIELLLEKQSLLNKDEKVSIRGLAISDLLNFKASKKSKENMLLLGVINEVVLGPNNSDGELLYEQLKFNEEHKRDRNPPGKPFGGKEVNKVFQEYTYAVLNNVAGNINSEIQARFCIGNLYNCLRILYRSYDQHILEQFIKEVAGQGKVFFIGSPAFEAFRFAASSVMPKEEQQTYNTAVLANQTLIFTGLLAKIHGHDTDRLRNVRKLIRSNVNQKHGIQMDRPRYGVLIQALEGNTDIDGLYEFSPQLVTDNYNEALARSLLSEYDPLTYDAYKLLLQKKQAQLHPDDKRAYLFLPGLFFRAFKLGEKNDEKEKYFLRETVLDSLRREYVDGRIEVDKKYMVVEPEQLSTILRHGKPRYLENESPERIIANLERLKEKYKTNLRRFLSEKTTLVVESRNQLALDMGMASFTFSIARPGQLYVDIAMGKYTLHLLMDRDRKLSHREIGGSDERETLTRLEDIKYPQPIDGNMINVIEGLVLAHLMEFTNKPVLKRDNFQSESNTNHVKEVLHRVPHLRRMPKFGNPPSDKAVENSMKFAGTELDVTERNKAIEEKNEKDGGRRPYVTFVKEVLKTQAEENHTLTINTTGFLEGLLKPDHQDPEAEI